LFIKVKYSEGPAETYTLPLSFLLHKIGSEEEMTVEGTAVRLDYDWLGVKAEKILEESSQAVVSRLTVDGEEGILYDSLYNRGFRDRIFDMLRRRRKVKGQAGELYFYPGKMFRRLLGGDGSPLDSRVLKAEQSNSSLIYDDRYFFKLYRKAAEGINPDMEIIRFLTEKTKFTHIPPYAGAVEYRSSGKGLHIIGLLQGLVPNQGDTWTYSLDAVKRYFEQLLARRHTVDAVELEIPLFDFESPELAPEIQDLVGGIYLEPVRLLGERTAELHLALSSVDDDPAFAPEPFSLLYQRSLYQSLRTLTRKVFQPLEVNIKKLSGQIRDEAKIIHSSEKSIIRFYEKIIGKKIPVTKTRIHGDYHLGQVLFTGKDFVIIDFEGEPARTLSERKLKRSPLVDVAGMIRSFHYAVHSEYFNHITLRPEDAAELEPWLDPWYRCISKTFLCSYVQTSAGADFIPKDMNDLKILLEVFMLEKAVYEVGYELNNRPDWLMIPLRGIMNILGTID
jgi:maltose alpha-D-glucosyltransferase/alpha-amylase